MNIFYHNLIPNWKVAKTLLNYKHVYIVGFVTKSPFENVQVVASNLSRQNLSRREFSYFCRLFLPILTIILITYVFLNNTF